MAYHAAVPAWYQSEMRKILALVASILLVASAAQADVIPSGQKGVRLSIRVDAEPAPAGKVLVLAHTWRGADRVEPGKVMPVDWHPMIGGLQFVLVDAAAAKQLDALTARDRDKANALTDAGLKCGGAFSGVRTIEESSKADEIRWYYRVTFTPEGCDAKRVRSEQLAEDGTLVSSEGEAPPRRPRGGCGACGMARESAPPLGSLSLFGLLFALRKRRHRKTAAQDAGVDLR